MAGPILPLSSRTGAKAARKRGAAARARNGVPSVAQVAALVCRRAQSQGFVTAREVRAELAQAGLDESLWKEVVASAGAALSRRRGKYHFVPVGPARMRVRVLLDAEHQRRLARSVRFLIRQQRILEAVHVERRNHPRLHFVCPVQVQTDDGRVLHLVSREISISGMRLLGTLGLRGQKVRVWVPRPDNSGAHCCFVLHVLWSAQVGDGLYESGGVFLELAQGAPSALKIVPQE